MANVQELNSVVDEIFHTLEEVKSLFIDWSPSCHVSFISKVIYLNTLRERLTKLGYTEEFADEVIKVAYGNVFTKSEQIQYAENWYIVA
jgi:hypothetical protein